jgi:iron(III) transport system substrate-binding protein
VNISGAGILVSAPHRANAVKFLEFMASDEAQDIVANANYEFPVVGTTKRSRELAALGEFKIDPLNVATYGVNQPQAQAIFDRAGWR